MLNKRGQITIFIAIGIILLIIVGAYFALTNNIISIGGNREAALPFDVQAVKTGLENCLALQLGNLLDQMSSQGGYFIPENPMVQYDYGFQSAYIPYYLYNSTYYAPSDEALMRQLQIGYNYYASTCYNYTDPNYDLILGQKAPSYQFVFKDNSVDVTVTYDIMLKGKYKNTTTHLEKFSATQYNDFFKHVSFARELTRDQMKLSSSICYSCIYDAASSQGIELQTEEINVGDAMAVFYVLDNKFVFANRIDFGYSEPEFAIDPVGDQVAEIDYPFTLNFTANKEVIKWSTNSRFFDIDKDGKILFNPNDAYVGSYPVIIDAVSKDGENATMMFQLDVVDPRGSAPYAPNVGPLYATVGQKYDYDINSTEEAHAKYVGVFDLFTIDQNTGKFSFTPTAKGVKSYDYYVIDKINGRSNGGKITIIIS